MDELVQQISSNTGVDPATCRTAAAIMLKFLLIEAEGEARELIALISCADEAVADAPELAGGGVLGVFSSLRSIGLGIGQIQAVATEVLYYANSKVGEDTVRRTIGKIPGLNQFI